MNLTPDIQNAGVYSICGSSGAAKRKGRREGTDRDGGSGGVQGKKKNFGGVTHCRKAKLLPVLGIHPCSYPSRLLVFRSLSFHSFFHLSLLFFFFFFYVALFNFSHSFIEPLVADSPAGWHGTGWQCLWGSNLWAGSRGLSDSPALLWSHTSRSQGRDQTWNSRHSLLILHHCCHLREFWWRYGLTTLKFCKWLQNAYSFCLPNKKAGISK